MYNSIQHFLEKGTKNLEFVLDKFHMQKYIIGAISHLLDSAEDVRGEINRAIYRHKKRYVEDIFNRIINVTDSSSKRKTVEAAKTYILENWSGIME